MLFLVFVALDVLLHFVKVEFLEALFAFFTWGRVRTIIREPSSLYSISYFDFVLRKDTDTCISFFRTFSCIRYPNTNLILFIR